MKIGDRIRVSRENKGITQEQLGTLCGTTKQTIYKYESGIVTNIPMDRLVRIAEALEVTPSFLMDWNDIPLQVDDETLLLAKRISSLPPDALQRILGYIDSLLDEQNL